MFDNETVILRVKLWVTTEASGLVLNAIVVLTNGFKPVLDRGRPLLNLETLARLERAVRAYQQGVAQRIILPQAWWLVEGKWFSMAAREQEYLVSRGIPPDAIITCETVPETLTGFTGGELRIALQICKERGWRQLGFVSNGRHLRRVRCMAYHIAKQLGWEIEFHSIESPCQLPLTWKIIEACFTRPLVVLFDRGGEGPVFQRQMRAILRRGSGG